MSSTDFGLNWIFNIKMSKKKNYSESCKIFQPLSKDFKALKVWVKSSQLLWGKISNVTKRIKKFLTLNKTSQNFKTFVVNLIISKYFITFDLIVKFWDNSNAQTISLHDSITFYWTSFSKKFFNFNSTISTTKASKFYPFPSTRHRR